MNPTLEHAIELVRAGNGDAAEPLVRAILEEDPTNSRAHNLLGIIHFERRQLEEARSSYLRALALDPADARVHINLGNLYKALKQSPDADRHFQLAIDLDPTNPGAHYSAALFLQGEGRLAEAEREFRKTIEIDPSDGEAHFRLAEVLRLGADFVGAEHHFRAAARLMPALGAAHNNLGVLLTQRGELPEAQASLRTAVRLAPDHAEFHFNLANALRDSFRFDEAEAHYRTAIGLKPGYAEAWNNLAMILLETQRIQEAQDACITAAKSGPGAFQALSNFIMSSQYDPSLTNAEHLARALRFRQAIESVASAESKELPSVGHASSRLNVGFVSADLHSHPVGLFLLPLLRNLDARKVSVTLYSNRALQDVTTAELRQFSDWRDISKLDDARTCAAIRDDRIDVLFDLSGHTGKNRLPVFARRCAPVQISWLGYFATTATPNMDYVLMDPWHAPAGTEKQFYERLIRLPHTRFCYEPLKGTPEVAAPPAERNDCITFGSFNNLAKVNPAVISLWARILRDIPGSRLVLKWRTLADPGFRAMVASRFHAAGVEPKRLELRPASAHLTLLAEYSDIDIALDPFPFCGGRTSFEALWMGVPIVTLAGDRPGSRQTLCILGNIGMQWLSADTPDDYIRTAMDLASDMRRLRELRRSMRQRMAGSPLMDGAGFACAFEETVVRAVLTFS